MRSLRAISKGANNRIAGGEFRLTKRRHLAPIFFVLSYLIIGSSAAAAPVTGTSGTADIAPPLGAEIATLRTAKSRTFHGPDGSLIAALFESPVNYRDASGLWQKIDTSLHRDKKGDLQNGGASFSLSLPQNLDQGPVAVSVGGSRVALQLLGAASDAVASNDTVLYAGALSDTDAIYRSTANGVKETLQLDTRSAPSVFRFHLDLAQDLTPSLEADGSIDDS